LRRKSRLPSLQSIRCNRKTMPLRAEESVKDWSTAGEGGYSQMWLMPCASIVYTWSSASE